MVAEAADHSATKKTKKRIRICKGSFRHRNITHWSMLNSCSCKISRSMSSTFSWDISQR